jgi:hypothetical protein
MVYILTSAEDYSLATRGSTANMKQCLLRRSPVGALPEVPGSRAALSSTNRQPRREGSGSDYSKATFGDDYWLI